ncbi:elongation factor 1-alpha [Nematocida sp. AWRm77]|nr:elongation factor 1-alpha [Nematocida sp. AWRm77]
MANNTFTEDKYINVCFLGHVDSGKSTTIGHFCFQMGAIDKRALAKLEDAAKALGKGSFSYAFFCDNNKAERESGITIQVAMKMVRTTKHMVNILDCPGHRDFLKNMITGTAQADVAVIIVPAGINEFETAISETGTLYEHIVLAHTLGVSKAIVAVNKIDVAGDSDAAREKRFNEIVENIKEKMKKMYDMSNTPIIPISGFKGVGLTKNGEEKFSWFKGWLPEDKTLGEKDANNNCIPVMSLEGAIDFYPLPVRETEAPLRMPITNVLEVKGIGRVYTGKVEYGKCSPGTKVLVAPAGISTEVKTMEIHKESKKVVEAGQNCGITLKDGDTAKKITPGNVISETARSPCRKTVGALALVRFTGKITNPLKEGYSPTMDLGSNHVSTRFAKIQKCGKMKGKEIVQDAAAKPGEIVGNKPTVLALLVPGKNTVMEKFSEYKSLGRFALRDMAKTIAVGCIQNTYTQEELDAAFPGWNEAEKKKSSAEKKKK